MDAVDGEALESPGFRDISHGSEPGALTLLDVLQRIEELGQEFQARFDLQSQELQRISAALLPKPSSSSVPHPPAQALDSSGSVCKVVGIRGLEQVLNERLLRFKSPEASERERSSPAIPPGPCEDYPVGAVDDVQEEKQEEPPQQVGSMDVEIPHSVPEPAPSSAEMPKRFSGPLPSPSSPRTAPQHQRAFAFSSRRHRSSGSPSNRDRFQRSRSRSRSLMQGLDAMRRRVEEDILLKGNATFTVVHPASDRSASTLFLIKVVIILDRASSGILRLAGTLPWSADYFWLSLVYQLSVLALHTGILGFLVAHLSSSFGASGSSPFLISDLILACGTVGGLLATGAFTGCIELQESLEKIEEANSHRSVANANALDALVTFLVWLAFLSDRLASLLVLESPSHLAWQEVLRYVAVIFSSGEQAVLGLLVLRMCRNMTGVVDNFCTHFCSSVDYVRGVSDWNVLQATVRTASGAVERCFAVLLSALVLQALAMVFDLRSLDGAYWALSAPGILILGLSQILLRASAVTDTCVRVPQLINATNSESEEPLDSERMFLVDYITASAAGFYVFNVRFGAGIGIKVLHYSGLTALTIARLVLPSGQL